MPIYENLKIWPMFIPVFALIRGHRYTRRLILGPISAARPQMIDLCTKNPPGPLTCIFETNWPVSVGSVVKGSCTNDVYSQSEKWKLNLTDFRLILLDSITLCCALKGEYFLCWHLPRSFRILNLHVAVTLTLSLPYVAVMYPVFWVYVVISDDNVVPK